MTSPLEGRFEPEAAPMKTIQEASAVSIAISLKRIADALDESRDRDGDGGDPGAIRVHSS